MDRGRGRGRGSRGRYVTEDAAARTFIHKRGARGGSRGAGAGALASFAGSVPINGMLAENFNHYDVIMHFDTEYYANVQLASTEGSDVILWKMRDNDVIEGAGGVTVDTLLQQLSELGKKK